MKRYLLMGLMCLGLTACASYYKVIDPTSGKAYYTMKVKELGDGAVRFTDERSQTQVTLQNSQVETLTKEQYDRATRAAEPMQ